MSTPAYSPPLDEVTTGLLDFFKQAGRPVYDGAYGGDPVAPVFPHAILYSLAGGNADPMPDLDLDLTVVTAAWQITAVSKFRNQAEQTARVFRDRLLARAADHADQVYANSAGWTYPLTPPDGWQITHRAPDPALAGVTRTGDPPNAIFSAPFRFTLIISPA